MIPILDNSSKQAPRQVSDLPRLINQVTSYHPCRRRWDCEKPHFAERGQRLLAGTCKAVAGDFMPPRVFALWSDWLGTTAAKRTEPTQSELVLNTGSMCAARNAWQLSIT